MRLSGASKESILEFFRDRLPSGSELHLVGSRTDDSKKGGDIDLLVLTQSDQERLTLSGAKPAMLVGLKDLLGDQRIDLTIVNRQSLDEKPIIKLMLTSSVRLI
jgi:hypothetical protein